MFQLDYFILVEEILFHDEDPTTMFMNDHENILEILFNKQTEKSKRQQVMLERPMLSCELHEYIQTTYPPYFDMNANSTKHKKRQLHSYDTLMLYPPAAQRGHFSCK